MAKDIFEKKLVVEDNHIAQRIVGPHHEYIDIIQEKCNVDIHEHAPEFVIFGDSEESVNQAYDLLLKLANEAELKGDALDAHYVLRHVKNQKSGFEASETIKLKKKSIKPRTANQQKYVNAIRKYDMVFGLGDAGTGKTFLAVACALEQLEKGHIDRIILTRPAVEAGERLGFLPGDMKEKVAPYLQPLFDALRDMSSDQDAIVMAQSGDTVNTSSQNGSANAKQPSSHHGKIEIAPLAFMRGRTLSRAAIILDEAQNTTKEQMKMFLTRLGEDSKMIITGDPSQIDLPGSAPSGLNEAMRILEKTEGIAFIHFDDQDVQRHQLVGRIIRAYKDDAAKKS